MNVPHILLDHIREGQVVLFLGAGASIGALHKNNKTPPVGTALSTLIADKFLGEDFRNRSLAQVAELAISETDLFTVQEYIASLFRDFYPNTFHKLIPRFVWKAIATTNYDLIIERAYEEVSNRLQFPVVFKKNGERVEQKLSGRSDILYLKLHGSITDINDPSIPLILTTDQYITHRRNRSRLFDRLKDLAYEHPMLFVGHSLIDPDLRTVLLELSQLGDAKPRSYLVDPFVTEQDIRFWESRRVTAIKASFTDFMEYIDTNIPENFRILATQTEEVEHPIFKRFAVTDRIPSRSLLTLLQRDVDYLHKGFKTGDTEPKAFYKGYFPNWDPIEMGLDVRRGLSDGILSEVFLVTEEEKSTHQELVAIKGHAGSGKTVILRRLAWDAAVEFNKLCLAVKDSANPEYDPLYELYTLCKERIYLFIDSASDYADLIEFFLRKARRDKFPLTIITNERLNEWNAYCENLESFLTYKYIVDYLSPREIEQLIKLLEKYKSLGHLEDLPIEEQREALSKQAGRQLLVALHEATLGKPFKDIVFDEYKSIPSPQAKLLYLTVCILHRLGVVTRAGVVSRVHGIPFTQFKDRLFKPLEFIVFATENKLIGDYEYRTRHPHIAEMVFERALVDQQDRYDEYVRILSALDVDFNADRDAFKGMTNAKHLLDLFSDPEMVRSIFTISKERTPNDPMLLQQEAIFEMNVRDGDLDKASRLLTEAHRLAPWSEPIGHSLAEVAFRKSERARSEVEKNKYRRESKELAAEIASKNKNYPHPFHTLIKVGLSELEDIIKLEDDTAIEIKVKDLEKTISSALQTFPDESFILDANARFNKLIDENPKALASLERAFKHNKKSPYIALRLANALRQGDKKDKAIAVLREAVEAKPLDKDLNYNLAKLLMQTDGSKAEIRHFLRSSFTKGDTRYDAQFWFARLLYLEGEINEARDYFRSLKDANVPASVRQKPRGKIIENKKPIKFLGTITKVEASYGFIARDERNEDLFLSRFHPHMASWEELHRGMRVKFEIAFNYRGAIALNVQSER
jgi:tetratricopeptide (TPR) repeat protein